MTQLTRRGALLSAFIERVWSCGDVDQSDHYLAERYTLYHDPGDPWDGLTLDLEGFKERVRISRKPFPDQRFEIQQRLENETSVAITWLWSATHLGDVSGFPATGKRIRMSGATVYAFDAANRLTGHWQVVDRLGAYRQLQQNA